MDFSGPTVGFCGASKLYDDPKNSQPIPNSPVILAEKKWRKTSTTWKCSCLCSWKRDHFKRKPDRLPITSFFPGAFAVGFWGKNPNFSTQPTIAPPKWSHQTKYPAKHHFYLSFLGAFLKNHQIVDFMNPSFSRFFLIINSTNIPYLLY